MSEFPYRATLDRPVIGMESEFVVFVDGEAVVPAEYWRYPTAFIERPVLKRTQKSAQLPTGGAVYFDRDVLEVVTPVIELAPHCTARMARNLWEQIAFLREELTRWGRRTGHQVRLQGFSSHYNVSFELPRPHRGRNRTIQKLALLLAHVLPAPVIVLGANRRSTGVGVRPRRNRIEVTLDFTPDPGLMVATAAVIVGIVREMMSWDSYLLSQLSATPVPILAGVKPGKHTSRKGWLTKDLHFPTSPFLCDPDERVWKTTGGEVISLREIALRTALFFRQGIRRYSDPFTEELLFAVLRGQMCSQLDLPDRPAAYEDVGRLCQWGEVLPDLQRPDRRKTGRGTERRKTSRPVPLPVDRLSRSAYETVFRKLGSGSRLKIGREILTPIGMKGWSQAIFRRESDGEEQMLSIDQLVRNMNRWIR